MPYLTCVGPEGANSLNKDKIGSRGYWIFRRGQSVVTRWGPIVVNRHKRSYQVRWVYFKEKVIRCGSTTRAGTELKRIVAKQLGPSLGYLPLSAGVKIH